LSRVASDRIGPAEGDGPDGRAARRVVWILIAVPATGLALAWLSSQASPAFTGRYFAVLLGPLLLLAGIGLSRAGGLGLACLAIVFVIWLDPRTSEIDHKSDARVVAARIEPHVRAGDLAVSVHPEQAPLLHYYFKPGLRYATSLGMMPDPQVFDWRDALQRLRDADPYVTLNALLRTLRPGQRLVLVLPIIRTSRWGAPWTKLVRERSAQWEIAADRNAGLRRLMAEPRFGHGRLPRGVRAVIYERT
ncbi:MAG: hypothetical protein JWM31_2950, partial [Solirubrobacterales bacterium]|nr:hypothetical protein [Solirubrobacterales bacterium]